MKLENYLRYSRTTKIENPSKVTNDRETRWNRRQDRLNTESTPEPLVLNEDMINQWLSDHRVEYTSATETVKACLQNFRLHRRHRKLVWYIFSRTDLSHLGGGI